MSDRPLGIKFVFLSLAVFFLWPLPQGRAEFTHVVKKGESLSVVARQYGLTVSDLQEANEIEGTRIRAGQKLIIPREDPGPSASAGPPGGGKGEIGARPGQEAPTTHEVQKGETLIGISRRYGLTVKDLQNLNSLVGSGLKAGQVLLLKPGDSEKSSGPVPQGRAGAPAPLPGEAPGQECSAEEADCQTLVAIARSLLGVKYRRGGSSLTSGVDCSAYVQKVFQKVGVDLPRTAREQFESGLEVARDALRLGDLVFFRQGKGRRPGHVGIYIGDDQFIHSSTTKRKVRIDSLNTRYFSIRFLGGRRIQEIEDPPPVSQAENGGPRVSQAPPEPAESLPRSSQAPAPRASFHPDLQFLAGR